MTVFWVKINFSKTTTVKLLQYANYENRPIFFMKCFSQTILYIFQYPVIIAFPLLNKIIVVITQLYQRHIIKKISNNQICIYLSARQLGWDCLYECEQQLLHLVAIFVITPLWVNHILSSAVSEGLLQARVVVPIIFDRCEIYCLWVQ